MIYRSLRKILNGELLQIVTSEGKDIRSQHAPDNDMEAGEAKSLDTV